MSSIFRFGGYGAGVILAGILLAGCAGGGSSTLSAPWSVRGDVALTMPHFVQPELHTDRGQSWMRPGTDTSRALIYVGDWSTNDVFVYDYKSGASVGRLTGNDEPYGMCVDAKGDIYVSNFGSGTVNEYAHGGTTPINTYSPGGELIGCAVDSKGDLAATSFDPGDVTVYAGGDPSKGTTYSDSSCEYLWTMGYDDKGDLIGVGEYSSIEYCALLAGSKTMTTLSSGAGITIDFPGGTTWDGKYIALGAQEGSSDSKGGAIIQAELKGTKLIYVGKTVMTDNCDGDYVSDVNPFIAGKTNALWHGKQGNVVVGPNLWCVKSGTGRVDYWHYPAGGSPFETLPSPPGEPYGAAVSLAPK